MSAKLFAAVMTGVFCSVFAVVIDMVMDIFSVVQLMGVSFVSGFLGSLFGNTLIGFRK